MVGVSLSYTQFYSPCQTSFDYLKWNNVRRQKLQQVTCQNENDRQSIVFAVGCDDIGDYFEHHWKELMLERPSATAYEWALRLGAKGHEAENFSQLLTEEDIWDYVSALLARSGIIRYQPLIARDIEAFVKATGLPLLLPYGAIYIHIGEYGHQSQSEGRNIASFEEYLQLFDSIDCNDETYPVYIVSDDLPGIQQEIDRMNASGGGAVVQACLKMNFILSPVSMSNSSHNDGIQTDCLRLYHDNIASIANVMILSKSDTFAGEFNSNLGGLVRIFRSNINNFPRKTHSGPVLVRSAFSFRGSSNPGPQGSLGLDDVITGDTLN